MRVVSPLLAAAFLLPDLSAAARGPACPHHGLAPRAADEVVAHHAGGARHRPAVQGAQREGDGLRVEPPGRRGGSGRTAPWGEDRVHASEPSRGLAASGTTGLRREDGAYRSEHSNGSGGWGASALRDEEIALGSEPSRASGTTSPSALRHEEGAHRSHPASCTCVGPCHAGGAVPAVASAAGLAIIAVATTTPAPRRDDPRPPSPDFLLPYANAPPTPLLA